MAFLPRDFIVPATLETPRWRMRSITIHDVVKDFDAVMSSREHLWARFGASWGWPAEDWTLEGNLMHLGWHQHEFELRSSFDYAVMSNDERRLLGCVYVDPPHPSNSHVEAEIWFWGRQSELANGLEEDLDRVVRHWLASCWPFKRVLYQGDVLDLAPAR
jgi:hypothetical protein